MDIQKYDIFLGDFDPKKGSTQAGIRPCVIIQSNVINKFSPTCLVVPLTSNISKCFPNDFLIYPSKLNGLKEISRYLGNQIITLDKKYLLQKLGELDEKYFDNIKQSIEMTCDLNDNF